MIFKIVFFLGIIFASIYETNQTLWFDFGLFVTVYELISRGQCSILCGLWSVFWVIFLKEELMSSRVLLRWHSIRGLYLWLLFVIYFSFRFLNLKTATHFFNLFSHKTIVNNYLCWSLCYFSLSILLRLQWNVFISTFVNLWFKVLGIHRTPEVIGHIQ